MPARLKHWRTSALTWPRSRERNIMFRTQLLEEQSERKAGGPMKRITFLVLLAIVAFGSLAIRYSGGRTVNSIGENGKTTSRDGTSIAFTKRGSGPPLI